MTRGNQRETDRAKAQKKAAAAAKKPKESASSLAKRKESDAEILRAKQKVTSRDPLSIRPCLISYCHIRKRKRSEPQRLQVVANDHNCGPSKDVRYIWMWV
ncbi:hypothetical protein EDD85DRAFT_19325 [Armillaria nabsnona]|nr:hypothetical protein EDD85DRAFT_19325 [Armillaria nabsnona]